MQILLYMSHFTHDRVEFDENASAAGGWLHGGMQKPPLSAVGKIAETLNGKQGIGATAHLFLRDEDWGGLVFDTRTNSVFQSDKDAFWVFSELRLGNTLDDIVASHPGRREDLLEFKKLAENYGLL